LTDFQIAIGGKTAQVIQNKCNSDFLIPDNRNEKQDDDLLKVYLLRNLTDNEEIKISGIEKETNVSLGRSVGDKTYMISLSNIEPKAVVTARISKEDKNSMDCISLNDKKFKIIYSIKNNYTDYSKIMSIEGISKDIKIKTLETDNGMFFTGTGDITITMNIDDNFTTRTYTEIKSTDFIKVEFSLNENNVTVLDFNPFENI